MNTQTVVLPADLTAHEFEPKCGAENIQCKNPAVWIAAMLCCGHDAFLCDPCKRRDAQILRPNLTPRCRACKTTFPAGVFPYRWEPIR